MVTLSYGTLTELLLVGSYPQSPEDVLHLESLGVRGVLNLQSDADLAERGVSWPLFWRFYTGRGIQAVRYPILDFSPAELARQLGGAVDALDRLVGPAPGRRVYLHCTAGVNRSPSVAIAWLMRRQGLSREEAYALVKAGRPEAMPYPEVLDRWERTLRGAAR